MGKELVHRDGPTCVHVNSSENFMKQTHLDIARVSALGMYFFSVDRKGNTGQFICLLVRESDALKHKHFARQVMPQHKVSCKSHPILAL